MKVLVCVVCALLSCLAYGVETMTLVSNGKACFRVVVPDKADWPTKLAGEDIVRCVKEATGAKARMVAESKLPEEKEDLINLYVGLGKYTAAFLDAMPNPYGYLIDYPDTKTIIITGRFLVEFNYNTLDGVTYFLEKELGVYNLMPGELGIVIPKHQGDWQVKCQKVVRVPSLFARTFSGVHGACYTKQEKFKQTDCINWCRRCGMTVSLVLNVVHNVGNLIDPDKYEKTHPEFFPMINGKRFFPPRSELRDWRLRNWEPCYSAPGIAEETAKNVIEFFRTHPNHPECSLSGNDSGNICECERCKKLNAKLKPGQESQSYYEWVNKVAKIVKKECPNRYLGVDNYWATRDLPENVKLEDNVILSVAEDFNYYVDPKYRARLEKRLNAIDEMASCLAWWDYQFEGDYIVPAYNAKHTAEYLKHLYKNHNLRYYFSELHPGRHWKNAPETYMITKLGWDIDRDADEILDEWFTLAVGKEAAPYLKAYFQVWDGFWRNDIPKTSWFIDRAEKEIPFLQRRDGDYMDALKVQTIRTAMENLNKAVELAPAGKERMRAEFFRDWFAEASDTMYLPYINSKAIVKAGAKSKAKLLHHYGFDNDTEKWVSWQSTRHTAILSHDKTTGKGKPGSLKLDRAESMPTGMTYFRRPLDFKLEAGKNYRMRVWVRGENLSTDDCARFDLFFPTVHGLELGREHNANGTLNLVKRLLGNELKDGKWHLMEHYIAVPETCWEGLVTGVNCQLTAYASEHGVVWFDDFTIEELSDKNFAKVRLPEFHFAKKKVVQDKWLDEETGETLGPELVEDGNMEAADSSTWRMHYKPAVFEKTNQFAKNGKQCLHIVSQNAGDGAVQIIAPYRWDELFKVPFKPFEKDKEYRVQLWVKNMKPGTWEEIRLPGTTLKEPLKTDDNEWKKFVFRTKCTGPIATPYVVIGYGTKTSDCYVDDISIREIIKAEAQK